MFASSTLAGATMTDNNRNYLTAEQLYATFERVRDYEPTAFVEIVHPKEYKRRMQELRDKK